MPEELPDTPRTVGTRFSAAIAVAFIVVFALATYAFRERSAVKDLTARNTDMATALQQTRAQVDAINANLNELRAAQAAAASPAVPTAKPAAGKSVQRVVRRRADDPRWKKVQAQLDEQGKAIESTRNDLASARTELTGSIAKTHDELVVLEKKGERNYFEFDLDKSKQFSHTGKVGLKLRKANVKHQFADLDLLVDDVQLNKKHVNLYEPVVFYSEDNGRPIELVINQISKNHIHGYVSAPKYAASELANAQAEPPAPAPAPQRPASGDKDAPALRHR